jgi:hypothetical protein
MRSVQTDHRLGIGDGGKELTALDVDRPPGIFRHPEKADRDEI